MSCVEKVADAAAVVRRIRTPISKLCRVRGKLQRDCRAATAMLQDAIGYHCFRGLLTPNTEVYLSAASQEGWLRPGKQHAVDCTGPKNRTEVLEGTKQASARTRLVPKHAVLDTESQGKTNIDD